MSDGVRIAMWSGPRNISTALMRSWGNREDCYVCDEPLYAHYLQHTGFDHPDAAEIVAHHETDWRKVVEGLIGPIPQNRIVYYQKHMAHHLLPHIERDWLDRLTHVFLIRDPAAMISSYLVRRPEMTVEDSGLPQQCEIFDRIAERIGAAPPVVDSRDVLKDPRAMLEALCDRLEVAFDERMLHWEPGPRATDGIWAKRWYDVVEASTGFQPYKPKDVTIPEKFRPLVDECRAFYVHLHAHRLEPPAA
ncbi:MAG: HAD family hydrolase [Acidobacteria bacterium]|nr:HAD family hydrolase [Acidobacteriota bacterium]NIM60459.1 HAD family hydrolase [Acidobacteriota bacterium]NIQ29661.1 HAD family hydrolase [Acidobacteriota bacterium]NIQ84388.1 HAD family hydrolase [Acidobacteriota bacterium]NIT10327.1 HAD family hydrolase [Acidobacteriota bacterium]